MHMIVHVVCRIYNYASSACNIVERHMYRLNMLGIYIYIRIIN